MVSFKLFAGTDVGLRDNNEDNFTVCPDLSQNEWIIPADYQQEIQLDDCGCILVVADGMGGQNAGEVASAIAIATVQRMFSREELPDGVWLQSSSIKDYLKTVVKTADAEVKAYSADHADAEGLGSTIVMAWIVSNKVYVCWMGDSRAYAFIPGKGIGRLSKDHSYVQQLVDAGDFTDEEAMLHPNSNIITRSLGDATQKAKPEVAEYPLENDEIILLCSDGLCGVCKDEEIGGIVEANHADLKNCKDRLTEAALANGGSDNITIALLHVCGGVESVSNVSNRLFYCRSWKLWGGVVTFVILLLTLIFFLFPKEMVDKPKPCIRFAMRSIELRPHKSLTFRVKSHNENKYDFLCEDKRINVVSNENGATVSLNQKARYNSGDKVKLIVLLKADSIVRDTLNIVLKKIDVLQKDLTLPVINGKEQIIADEKGEKKVVDGDNGGSTNYNGSGVTPSGAEGSSGSPTPGT